MDLYLSERPDDIRRAAFSLQRLLTLYDTGVLTDDSTVWMRVNSVDPYLWILTDTSRLARVHLSSDPGCVRITTDRVRWGTTYESSAETPDDTVTFGDLPVDASSSFLYICEHMNPSATVSVVAKSMSQKLTGGFYDAEGIGVVDTQAYTPSNVHYVSPDGTETSFRRKDPSWESRLIKGPTDYQRSHAMVSGTAFITHHMNRRDRKFFVDNMDVYRVSMSREYLAQLQKITVGAFERTAQLVADQVRRNQEEAGIDQ